MPENMPDRIPDIVCAAMINSIEAQMDETSEPAPKECSTTQQVIENGQKIISHLESKMNSLEHEMAALMALISEVVRTSAHGISGCQGSKKLNLLEIYCEPDSQLVRVAHQYGLTAKRFTIHDGDLSTPEGQAKLWKIVEDEQPDHIWTSPECRYWGTSVDGI